MKKLFLFILLLISIHTLIAQTKPVTKKPVAAKPVATRRAPILKTLYDSASYAVGISVADVYKKQGFIRLNSPIISKAINECMGGEKTLLDEAAANQVINNYRLKIQSEKPGSKPVPVKPIIPKPSPVLKTREDSVSYAVGIVVAEFYKRFGVNKLNTACMSESIDEVLSGKKLLLDSATVNIVMNNYITQLQVEKSKPFILDGEKFLAKNKLRPEVKTTPSGLQYEVITEGTGVSPSATDNVTCNYKGTLIDGTEFDNSYKRGAPITFALKRVIPGWTEGLQLMKVGAKYKFYIPYQLGYGVFGNPPTIPGGSALIFEIDLLDVKKNP